MSRQDDIVDILARLMLAVVLGRVPKAPDAEKLRRRAKTPNQRPMWMVAMAAYWLALGKPAKAEPFIELFVRYGDNQRRNGWMTSDSSDDSWNDNEQMTSTHWAGQWALAYYVALWLGLRYGNLALLREGEWWVGCELYWFGAVDPFETGRVISSCARAKGTDHAGKPPKPESPESELRNRVRRMQLGLPRIDKRWGKDPKTGKKTVDLHAQLETGSDSPNVLAECLKRWKFPPVPTEAPKLAAPMEIVVTGSVVETFVRNPSTPAWVDVNGIEYTRFDTATGDVIFEAAAA